MLTFLNHQGPLLSLDRSAIISVLLLHAIALSPSTVPPHVLLSQKKIE